MNLNDGCGISRVAVLGAGTVGASWVLYFLSRGVDVVVHDSDAGRATYLNQYIESNWHAMSLLDGVARPAVPTVELQTSLEVALAGVQLVQECIPDDFALKRQLYERLDGLLPLPVIVASSTSSLLMSDLQRGLAGARRFVVAHPFNPPHLIPIVEVVGGQDTAPETVASVCAFQRSIGKTVLRLNKEVRGHLVNRLQAALFQEAVWLVEEGIADVADIDVGMALGPGIRWAAAGPFLTFHLGAQSGGIRTYLEHLGAAHERIWQDLGRPQRISPAAIDRITRGVEEETKDATVKQLAAKRDALLVALLRTAAESR